MKKHRTLSLMILSFLLAAMPASARLSLRQKKFAKVQDNYFNQDLDSTNKKCSTKIAARIDWESFKGEVDKQLDGKLHKSFKGFCAEPLGTIWHLCADSDGKEAIQKNVTSYICKYGGKGKRKIVLKGKTLTMWVDWDAGNYGPFVKKYLGKKL